IRPGTGGSRRSCWTSSGCIGTAAASGQESGAARVPTSTWGYDCRLTTPGSCYSGIPRNLCNNCQLKELRHETVPVLIGSGDSFVNLRPTSVQEPAPAPWLACALSHSRRRAIIAGSFLVLQWHSKGERLPKRYPNRTFLSWTV